jgi:coenzyme F420-0:L-glutamate ligase / coenzyme F420-1:gamma-L-glutamate ligase
VWPSTWPEAVVTIEIIPITGIPEIGPGDDLGAVMGGALADLRVELQDGDVVVITQKVVSKAEGRIVPQGPGGKAAWVSAESRRVVARRGDLVIAETRHGLVCANAGVDASNVAEGYLTLLPEDSDASAALVRESLRSRSGADVAVVITDTFGRPWRQGLVNVAIGCAGLPALVDLRATKDAMGRVLEATIVALADEVAAASGLVMGKAEGVPAAVIRGVHAEAPPLPAAALARPAEEDLFRESPMQALLSWTEAAGFGPGEVTANAVREALLAGRAALGGERPPWILLEVSAGVARRPLIEATESDAGAILATAPIVVVGFAGPPVTADEGSRRGGPEWDAALLAAGAALQNLVLAFHAQGLAARWIRPAAFAADAVRDALGVSERRILIGAVAAGPAPAPS